MINTKVMLETNGTLPDRLAEIIDLVDIISMDIKLPQMTEANLWAVHRDFLNIAKEKDVYVKLVVTGDIVMEDFQRAIDLVAEINPDILLILQPVTPVNDMIPVEPGTMLELQQIALEKLRDVRVIPQTHRMMDQL